MGYPKRLLFCGLMVFFCLGVSAQQPDVNRYTLFTGFDYMISPARNLTERGFEADFGVTVRPWLGLGGDFGALVLRKVGVRFATDWVNTHLFSSLLSPRQNYLRFSVGPTFRWGHLK